MDSSYMETQYHHQTQQPGTSSGLLRYRSAPTSLFDDVAQDLFTQNGYSGSGSGLGLGSSGLPPQYPKPTMVSASLIKRDVDESTKPTMVSTSSGGGLNLNRQSSSPAGFFTSLNTQNGYTMMSIGNFRGNGTNGESTSKLSMSHLPQIPEIGAENVKETNPKGMNFRNHDDHPGFDKSTRFSFSWNETSSEASHPSENGGLTTRPNVLMHHLSLPKTSSEMAAVEKLLHFQDTVPWKIRAKRGCATHPRSIAERMRRNRISERMRKLQDLVPNMDKQTNTADMLDFAVEYIKTLQDQYKALSDIRARCKCVNLKHSVTNHAT